MRILSIGTDRKLFEEGSAVRMRQKAYAEKLGSLDIIVFSKGGGPQIIQGGSVQVLSTASATKLLYGWDAWRMAKTLPRSDVVTAQDPFETGLISLFIARMLGVPLHVQVHTDFLMKGFVNPSFSVRGILNRVRRWIAWFVLRRAARIRVTLERTKDELVRRGIKAPITVLPIFVDVARFAAIPRTKHPKWKIAALCVGRLEKEKRFELAIDAVAAARKKGHDIGLTVVGSGSQLPILRERAMRAGIIDRVEFAGWQGSTLPFYSTADIVIVPSQYEGYGLVIIEALAAGIPVLATDVGVAREAGAIVVGAKEFPQALLRWIENGPRQAALAQAPYNDQNDYIERYCDDIAAASRPVL
ncbi:glycosyltransferase family 4 protein [Candidatus Kaiserbacteria bacterium]|nr:glycosyltransferase family 4 protein [Candidatus Kaiserbacteria bacterium]